MMGTLKAKCWSPAFVLIGLATMLCQNPAYGVEVTGNVRQKLKLVPACSALLAAATLDHVPLDGMGLASATNGLQPGDSATVLVTYFQKGKETQWLLYVEATTNDLKKKVTEKPAEFTVTSSFGPPMKFDSRLMPVKLRLSGPFAVEAASGDTKPTEKNTRFSLNEDFLGLGLDQAAALLCRWSATTNFGTNITSKALLALSPTAEEERAICASFPALMSYCNIVQHTDGLEDLLYKLVKLPSIWSMIGNGGVDASVSFGNGLVPSPAEPDEWNLPASVPVYYFPWLLRLNNQPALKITLVVTRPNPPLLICGGVVGLLAERIGEEDTYMTLRVVNAGATSH